MQAGQIRGHLDMLLLAVLASGPSHGYALGAELGRRSDGALAIVEGTLYPALHRLEKAGFVVSSVETTDGRQRRSYALTDDGKSTLAEEIRSWALLKACIEDVLDEIP